MTYSDKKVDHKKYIKGEVDLLRHVARPLLALFDTLTAVAKKTNKSINSTVSHLYSFYYNIPGCIDEINDEGRDAQYKHEHNLMMKKNKQFHSLVDELLFNRCKLFRDSSLISI